MVFENFFFFFLAVGVGVVVSNTRWSNKMKLVKYDINIADLLWD